MNKKAWLAISLLVDIFAINFAIIAAYYVRFSGSLPDFNFNAYTQIAVIITITYLGAAYLSSVYTIEELLGSGLLEPVFKAVSINWVILGGIIWFNRAFSFPRLVYFLSWFFAIVIIYFWRYLSLNIFKIDWPKQNILLVGTKPITKDIIEKLNDHKQWGYEISGIISDSAADKSFHGVRVLGTTDNIVSLINRYSISRIIITIPLRSTILEKIAEAGMHDLKIEVVPDLYEILVGRVDYSTLTDIPLLELTNSNATSSYRAVKRILDIIFSLIGLIIFTPLIMMPAGIIIKFTSRGSIFYIQERVGKNGAIFRVIKLRTMYNDAESSSGPVFAEKNDKRITTIGRILRKYRFDELPQFVNILKGQMSFVGPRPERPEFVEKYTKEVAGYASRLKLKPGATGLAQISGSYATDVQNKLKFDLFYLYHRSLVLDMKIVFKTIRVIISGTGSH